MVAEVSRAHSAQPMKIPGTFCLVAGYVRLYWSPTSEWHRGGDNFHYSVTWYVESDSDPSLAASPDWERVSGNRAFVDVEAEPGVCSCVHACHDS